MAFLAEQGRRWPDGSVARFCLSNYGSGEEAQLADHLMAFRHDLVLAAMIHDEHISAKRHGSQRKNR